MVAAGSERGHQPPGITQLWDKHTLWSLIPPLQWMGTLELGYQHGDLWMGKGKVPGGDYEV